MCWCNGRRDGNYLSHHQVFVSWCLQLYVSKTCKWTKDIILFFRWNEVNEQFRRKEQVYFQGLPCLILWRSHLKIRHYRPCLWNCHSWEMRMKHWQMRAGTCHYIFHTFPVIEACNWHSAISICSDLNKRGNKLFQFTCYIENATT